MIEAGEEIRLRHSLFNRLRENTVKLTLGKKLGLGFGTILTLMVSSAIFIYSKASALRETQTIVTEVRVPTVEACEGSAARTESDAEQGTPGHTGGK